MKYYLITALILSITACSAVGVFHTSDPYQKIKNSHAMMNQGRTIPAERFAKEALHEFEEKNDSFGQGEAHVALGLAYKKLNNKSLDKSIYHFKKAIESFKSIMTL